MCEDSMFIQKSDEFNATIHEFMGFTISEDILSIVIRAHLYLEREINTLLEYMTLESDNLIKERFATKLNIILAFGTISENYYRPLKQLNKIRNGYAHNINFVFDNDVYENFLSTFSKKTKDRFIYNLTNIERLKVYFQYTNEEINDVNSSLTKKFRILLAELLFELKMKNLEFKNCVEISHMNIQIKNNELELSNLKTSVNEYQEKENIINEMRANIKKRLNNIK